MDFVFDPSLVLYLPLYELDGASFMSKDARGHLCTVTGSLWRPKGRYFDKIDDSIVVPTHSSFADLFDGGGTFIAWVNPASDGEANIGHIASTYDGAVHGGWTLYVNSEATGKVKLTLYKFFDGGDGEWQTTATEITINTLSSVAITYDADATTNDPIFYINGSVVAITENRTPAGNKETDTDNLNIGCSVPGSSTWDNLICEIMAYNRILTPQEIQHNYLATKWRYR